MIPVDQVLALHRRLILEHGGSEGIRDIDALRSALDRAFQSFEGRPLYPTTLHKGAALIESVISNHPFVDGNKRTGLVVAFTFLELNGLEMRASEEDAYETFMSLASGKLTEKALSQWLEKNSAPHESE